MTCYEEFRNAIASRNPAALRGMADRAAEKPAHLSLLFLAEIVEEQNRKTLTRMGTSADR